MASWEIHFHSDLFQPFLPEKCQNNPGVYGFELAAWLAKTLAQQGVITSYPIAEDWGWFIEYTDERVEMMICCGSIADIDQGGAVVEPIEWMISLVPRRSLFRKPKMEQLRTAQDYLAAQIMAALHTVNAHTLVA